MASSSNGNDFPVTAGGGGTNTPQQEEAGAHAGACTICRRKKQKCSRDDPCKSCIASGSVCVYEDGQRRGAKPGYIDALVKRMDTLEALVLGQSLLLSNMLQSNSSLPPDALPPLHESSSLDERLSSVRQALLVRPPPQQYQNQQYQQQQNAQFKRPRTQSSTAESPASVTSNNALPIGAGPAGHGASSSISSSHAARQKVLPPPSMMRDLVNIYFSRIHPWIPILHEPTFESAMRAQDPQNQPAEVVLQAITSATIRFYATDRQTQDLYHSRCHDAVVLASMDRFSVETLQASIILAFNTVGSGRGPRSWSLVASATRIVEQLGLAVEEEDAGQDKLLNRIGFLPSAKNWTEKESLRRIFWCIFLADRFCSVSTGWNTSLTSDDIRRRLPVEGCFWRDRVEKKARYFDIDNLTIDPADDLDAIGGLAYLVEASEALNRVASFLLRETVDITNGDSLRKWFERFQALDAMLVRWKTFLPARWQVAGIDAAGKMDENLTLAHITHNTSVIMLHQIIAYPDTTFRHRLPSQNAAKTCTAAAGEIATIAAKFTANTICVIPPALSFCLFIAARVLLADSNHFGTALDHNFEILLQALREGSARWTGAGQSHGFGAMDNLAGQFAERIDAARRSRSPINVRSVALHEEPQAITFASPPIPEVFRGGSGSGSDIGSQMGIAVDEIFTMPGPGVGNFERIFTWTDEMIGQ